jgi:hypothetical protein
MDQDEIAQIARAIVLEIIPDLKARLSLTFTENLHEPILDVTAGSSVLHLNPQRWAVKILNDHVAKAPLFYKEALGDDDLLRSLIINGAKKDLIQFLCTVNLMLGDALWILEELSHAVMLDYEFGPFWGNVRLGVKSTTLLSIDSRLRKILNLPEKNFAIAKAEQKDLMGAKHDYAITDTQMITALKQLDRFSINGLAKLLAPERDDFRKSVYDWMRRKHVDRDELQKWWRSFRSGVEKLN